MAVGKSVFYADGTRTRFPNPVATTPGDVQVDGVTTAYTIGGNNEIIFETAPAAGAEVSVFPSSTELAAQDAISERDPQGGWVPEHQWQLDTQLRFRLPSGYWGEWTDLRGPAPAHQWSTTQLRFKNPDDTWGTYVDVRGPAPEHSWSGTQLRFRNPDNTWGSYVGLAGPVAAHGWSGTQLRFANPDGSWGSYVDLKGAGVPAGGSTGQRLVKNSGTDFDTVWTTDVMAPHIRQTISTAPVDSAGASTFLPGSSASLTLTTQNLSGSAPLILAMANGYDAVSGPTDALWSSTSNFSWTITSGAGLVFLYVKVDGTKGYTTLAPIYQWGGTPSTTNGQYTFNFSEMKGYLGNGSAANPVVLCFVGECTAGASSISGAVAYAVRGRYDSGWTNTLPSLGVLAKAHNIGTDSIKVRYLLKCLTTEGNYAVGDIVDEVVAFNGSSYGTVHRVLGRVSLSLVVVNNHSLFNKTSGSFFNCTAVNWAYRVIAERAL